MRFEDCKPGIKVVAIKKSINPHYWQAFLETHPDRTCTISSTGPCRPCMQHFKKFAFDPKEVFVDWAWFFMPEDLIKLEDYFMGVI